jgi:hypothetical protein
MYTRENANESERNLLIRIGLNCHGILQLIALYFVASLAYDPRFEIIPIWLDAVVFTIGLIFGTLFLYSRTANK